jgi:hypothetical protein
MIHSLYCILYLNDCDSVYCVYFVLMYYTEYFCIIQWQVQNPMGTKPCMDLMNA